MMKKYGFSLIELIITMTIMGILAGVVTPTFMGYQNKKKISFSLDLLETALQKSFSSSRSEPMVFGIKGTKMGETYTLFSCKYTLNDEEILQICNEEMEEKEKYTERILSYESGVMNDNNFVIQFLPPHGDIDTMNSKIDNDDFGEMNLLTLKNTSTEETRQLRVYKESGLITKYTK